MHVILLILKIIGIVLLVILTIILFLILSLLFAPFVYRISARKDEGGEISDAQAGITLSWMFVLLRAKAVYKDGELCYGIRLFGIDVFKLASAADRIKQIFKKKPRKQESAKEKSTEEKNAEVKNAEVKSAEVESAEVKSAKEKSAEPKETSEERDNGKKTEVSSTDDKETGTGRRQSFKDRFSSVKETIGRIRDAKDEIDKKKNKQALSFAWGLLKKALKSILPKKLKGKITFGFKGPDTTGKVLGIAAVFLPIYKDRIKVIPDFTKSCIYGNIYAKGKIRIFTLLLIYIKLRRSREYGQLMRLKKRIL